MSLGGDCNKWLKMRSAQHASVSNELVWALVAEKEAKDVLRGVEGDRMGLKWR